jgi:2-polyprenyl-3-methyl-5-hydroxy-6-metoxy-1,4-benzoquinol methylase
MIFVDPNQIDAEYPRQYEENISSTIGYYKLAEGYDKKSFTERLKELDSLYGRRGMLLEIGCSIGTFLKLARSDGWSVTGVEPNKAICSYLKGEEGNLTVFNAFFDKNFVKTHDSRYDVVYSSDVIEHTSDPVSFLECCKTLLKEGGIIVVITPDFDSILTRLFQIKPKQHMVYLNRENIKKLFKTAGLDVIKVKTIHRYRSIRAMPCSTTFTDASNCSFMMPLVKIINMLKINFVAEIFLDLFNEDLMIVAK